MRGSGGVERGITGNVRDKHKAGCKPQVRSKRALRRRKVLDKDVTYLLTGK